VGQWVVEEVETSRGFVFSCRREEDEEDDDDVKEEEEGGGVRLGELEGMAPSNGLGGRAETKVRRCIGTELARPRGLVSGSDPIPH